MIKKNNPSKFGSEILDPKLDKTEEQYQIEKNQEKERMIKEFDGTIPHGFRTVREFIEDVFQKTELTRQLHNNLFAKIY